MRAVPLVPASDARWDLLGPPGTSRDLLGPIFLNTYRMLGPLGTTWDLLGPSGTSRELLGALGTSSGTSRVLVVCTQMLVYSVVGGRHAYVVS